MTASDERDPPRMAWLLPPMLYVGCLGVMIGVHLTGWLPADVPLPLRWLGLTMGLVGLFIARLGATTFRTHKTNIHTFRPPTRFVTDGLFAYSRNPMYLGFGISVFGFALAFGSFGGFGVAMLFVAMLDRWYVRFEERCMLETFGNDYVEYCRKVRRWL